MILEIKDQLNQIHKIRNGEIKEGLALGIKSFDTYFRFKKGTFNIFLGHSNVGKTHSVLFFMFLYALKHDLRFLIYTGENEPYSILRKLLEYKEGMPINKIDEEKLKEGSQWVDSHFKFISIDEQYTYTKLLELGTQIKKSWDYQGFFIDPYNSLEKDRDMARSLGMHEHDYKACSDMRMFCHKTGVALWLSVHAVTESLRRLHGTQHDYAGHPVPPMMSDCEGGGKFGNRCDNFMVIHRYIQHNLDWMITNLHVRKVKDTDTGMMPTTLDSPVRIRSLINNVGFSIDGENMIDLMNDEHTGESIQKT